MNIKVGASSARRDVKMAMNPHATRFKKASDEAKEREDVVVVEVKAPHAPPAVAPGFSFAQISSKPFAMDDDGTIDDNEHYNWKMHFNPIYSQ